jgi:hypothetical protein
VTNDSKQERPLGMATGSCSDPRHASQHPPHIAEIDGERFWCVGGWVRADGTIPGICPDCLLRYHGTRPCLMAV